MVELKTDKAPGGVQLDVVARDVRGSTGIFLVAAFACLIALLANCCAGQVNRGAPGNSTNADLNSLGLSNGVLTPTFNSSTLSYLATVTNDIGSVTVTPTSADAGATITVQGIVVASGVTSQSITLNVGDNSIAIIVTAANGTTTKVYTIVMTRAVGTSANADLLSLALSSGTLSPSFSSAVTSYSVSVAGSVSSVTATPTAADAGATITVQGVGVVSGSPSGTIALVVGANTITVVVTAANRTATRTYTTIVTRGILYGWELTPENIGLAGVGVDKYSLPLYSGPATPAANTTISLMKITSQLDLSNGGITIDRCWISPDPANVGQGVSMLTNWTGAPATIQDCDFDCDDMTDTQAHMAVVANSFLFLGNGNVLRCHITNAGQGIRVDGLAGTSLVIENNLVHNMWTADSSHVDAITIRKFEGASLLIKNNWADNSSIPASPAIFIQESDGVIDNTIIEGNYISSSNYGLGLEDGTVRFGRTYGNNMQMINNRFGPTGYYPPYSYSVDGGVGFAQISGNYLYDASNPPDYEGAPVN